MRKLHQTLFVLLTIRLLLPPGICVCQWHSPAARILVGMLQTNKDVPPPPPVEKEDDHEPGCPASKLAAGMGLRPVFQAPTLPTAAPEFVSISVTSATRTCVDAGVRISAFRPPDAALFLKVCALRI